MGANPAGRDSIVQNFHRDLVLAMTDQILIGPFGNHNDLSR